MFTELVRKDAKEVHRKRAQGEDAYLEPRDYAECTNLGVLYVEVRRLIDSSELLGTYDDPTCGCPGYFRIYGLGPKATAPKS